VVALLTLAIGIGANTAVFSVVNGVLLKPLAYPKPEELVAIWNAAPGAAGLASVSGDLRLSPSMYVTFAEENRTFQSLGVWTERTTTVTGIAEPEQMRSVFVSDGTLQALATPPEAGRWLGAADQITGGPETVMLGYGYWQRRFGGDRSVIGRNIRVEARPREIVGVMPKGFMFGNTDPELILPIRFERNKLMLAGFAYLGVGRLKPGVTLAQANADIGRLIPVWENSWTNGPGTNSHSYDAWRITPALRPLKQDVTGNVGDVLWILMGTIGIVMLIACANVANLLLVRAEARRQELAVRAALGAGWQRIVRELMIESLLLGLIGGALGLGLAYAGLQWLVAMGPGSLPRLGEIAIDPRALGFAVAVSLLSGMLFGFIPALKYAGPRMSNALHETLRGAGRALSQGRQQHRARNVLVVAQVALALVLLVSSGLMIRTFQALRSVDPGFTRPEQIQTVRISVPSSLIPEQERVARIQNEIVDKVAAIPGVTAVGYASAMPMEGIEPDWDAIKAEDKSYGPDEIPPLRFFQEISPGYFQAAGTRLLAGRDFTWTDLYGRRYVAMISQNLAHELWGTAQAAIGKHVRTGSGPWREVVGVVQDVRENGVHEPAPAMVYWPAYGESPYRAIPFIARTVTFAIRTERAGSEALLTQIQQAVWSVNASLPVASVRTMRDIYDRSLARTSFTLVMLGIAGAMALVLGLVGIYGVISYAVSQRRREIGIRLALGAQQSALRRMFVRHGLMLAGIGVLIGMAAATGLSRLMKSLLFGVSPLDPLTYMAVPVVLVMAVLAASYLPARRASAVDPVEDLRAD
jgi:predicted permease